MSRFAALLPIGDGTRDRGEEARAIEYDKKGVKIIKGFKTEKSIPISDIQNVDVWRESSNTKGQNAAGRAAAGGLLFGLTGALVGAATADSYYWYGEIVTQTETVKFRFHKETDTKGFIKWWEKNRIN